MAEEVKEREEKTRLKKRCEAQTLEMPEQISIACHHPVKCTLT